MARKVKRRAIARLIAMARDAIPEAKPEAEGDDDGSLIEQARRNLMRGVPAATAALADAAASGSAAHIKLLLQLVKLDDGALASRETRPKEETLREILEEQWANTP